MEVILQTISNNEIIITINDLKRFKSQKISVLPTMWEDSVEEFTGNKCPTKEKVLTVFQFQSL